MAKSRQRRKPVRHQPAPLQPAEVGGKPWWFYLTIYGAIAFLIMGMLSLLLTAPAVSTVTY